MQATAKDLRFHAAALLDTVKRGEEVVITYRGKPCAKLVPISDDSDEQNREDELFGIWKDDTATQDVDLYLRKIRRGRFDVN